MMCVHAASSQLIVMLRCRLILGKAGTNIAWGLRRRLICLRLLGKTAPVDARDVDVLAKAAHLQQGK